MLDQLQVRGTGRGSGVLEILPLTDLTIQPVEVDSLPLGSRVGSVVQFLPLKVGVAVNYST